MEIDKNKQICILVYLLGAAATITIPDLDNATNGAVDVFYVNTPYDVAGTTTQIWDPQIVEPILENVNGELRMCDFC